MANTITVGRMTFTSPERIDISSVVTGNRNSLDRSVLEDNLLQAQLLLQKF